MFHSAYSKKLLSVRQQSRKTLIERPVFQSHLRLLRWEHPDTGGVAVKRADKGTASTFIFPTILCRRDESVIASDNKNMTEGAVKNPTFLTAPEKYRQ